MLGFIPEGGGIGLQSWIHVISVQDCGLVVVVSIKGESLLLQVGVSWCEDQLLVQRIWNLLTLQANAVA